MTINAASWPWPGRPVCLVTGSARGLGRAVAEALARRGATALISARQHAEAEAVAAEFGEEGLVALETDLDVADLRSAETAAATIGHRYGGLDVLVNNAAAYVDWGETCSRADLDRSRAVMDTNLYGAWNTIQAMLPLLRSSRHPRIVNVASGAGSHGDPQFGLAARAGAAATYGISKAALLALTSTLAAELAGTPIIVNAVDPGLTATWPGAENMGARPASESVPGIVWAATLPDDGPRGGFFRDGQPHPW
jgi:NAD(P)-dependent dehydrogenase (short-subunit alcohol dehydrogenase family)